MGNGKSYQDYGSKVVNEILDFCKPIGALCRRGVLLRHFKNTARTEHC